MADSAKTRIEASDKMRDLWSKGIRWPIYARLGITAGLTVLVALSTYLAVGYNNGFARFVHMVFGEAGGYVTPRSLKNRLQVILWSSLAGIGFLLPLSRALVQMMYARANGGVLATKTRAERREVLQRSWAVYKEASLNYEEYMVRGEVDDALSDTYRAWQKNYVNLARAFTSAYVLTDDDLTSLKHALLLGEISDAAQAVHEGMEALKAGVPVGQTYVEQAEQLASNSAFVPAAEVPEATVAGAAVAEVPVGATVAEAAASPSEITDATSTSWVEPKPIVGERAQEWKTQRLANPEEAVLENGRWRISFNIPPAYIVTGIAVSMAVYFLVTNIAIRISPFIITKDYLYDHGCETSFITFGFEVGGLFGAIALLLFFVPGALYVDISRSTRFEKQLDVQAERIFADAIMTQDALILELQLLADEYPDYATIAQQRIDNWEETLVYMSDKTGFGDGTQDMTKQQVLAYARYLGMVMRSMWRTRALLENDATAWEQELSLLVYTAEKSLAKQKIGDDVLPGGDYDRRGDGCGRLMALEQYVSRKVKVARVRGRKPADSGVEKEAEHLATTGAIDAQEYLEGVKHIPRPTTYTVYGASPSYDEPSPTLLKFLIPMTLISGLYLTLMQGY